MFQYITKPLLLTVSFYFQAGIDSNRLVIALEPEAASIFCKELPVEKFEGGSDNINVFSTGQRYLVLDAGGNNNYHFFLFLCVKL